jgi:hypothetical protein
MFGLGTKGMIAVVGEDGLAMFDIGEVAIGMQVESVLLGLVPATQAALACPIKNNDESNNNVLNVFFILIPLYT